jgi:CRISPR-associated protein Cas1
MIKVGMGTSVPQECWSDGWRIDQTIEGADMSQNTENESESLLPVRMLNEFAYCPRLYYLMHVDGLWADNTFTEEGKEVHRRVDRLDHVLPDPTPSGGNGDEKETVGDDRPAVSRSVSLSSVALGLTSKLDLVATDGEDAVPVETKRGRVPDNPDRSWEPERIQLMAQGMLLREHGYRTDYGVLYFAESRTRVRIDFDEALEARTRELIADARAARSEVKMPPPLDDSPKCVGCSLSGICLPDETLALQAVLSSEGQDDREDFDTSSSIRRLYPSRDEALPFYIQEQGAKVGKSQKVLTVKREGIEIGRARLKDVSQVVLLGNISISAQTLHLLCEAAVPVVHYSTGFWFYGITHGMGLRNAFVRRAQFEVASDPERCLYFARAIVEAKGWNQRTIIGRNVRPRPKNVGAAMQALLKKVPLAKSQGELLGLEGSLAAHYFGAFGQALKPRDFESEWDFKNRNRRPPKDPVNALLSFGYAILAKECTVALMSEGLDPWWGLFHQPRHGRPALALDLMEEFRPLVVDSAVLTAINTGMVTRRNFTQSKAGCIVGPGGRKGFLRAFEARMDQLVTHPLFGYRCSWRSIVRTQARLLARWLRGDIPSYVPMRTR